MIVLLSLDCVRYMHAGIIIIATLARDTSSLF